MGPPTSPPFDWGPRRPKQRALIVDIDDTLCVHFDVPVLEGVRLLAALDRSLAVHYVTARPEAARAGTEQFIVDHHLPGWKNLHFCPEWMSSRRHKREVTERLAKEYAVVASIGDANEDAEAAAAAGVRFVRVTCGDAAPAWVELEKLLAEANEEG